MKLSYAIIRRLLAFFLLSAVMVLFGCDSDGSDGGGGEETTATVRFADADATVSEGDTTATITVEISDAGSEAVSVDVGFDAEASEAASGDVGGFSSETVSFPAGADDGTTRDVTVSLTDDEEAENTETATFALQSAGDAEIGAPETFDLDIEDNDEETPTDASMVVQFASAGGATSEDAGTATLTVQLARPADADDTESVSVDVAFDDADSDAALADVDSFSTETVSFPADAADGDTRDVTVSLTDDEEAENTETAVFVLRGVSENAEIGMPSAFDLDIEDDGDANFVPVEIVSLDCPAELETGEDGTFTATINEGEATTPISSSWAFDDGTTAAGLVAIKTYDEAGSYEVTFTASNEGNGGESSSTSETCTVEVEAPPAPAMIASTDAAPNPSDVGESVNFTADVEGDTPIECEWDFGDGSTGSGCETSHTYDAEGEYTVTLTASNDAGEDTATLTQEVERANPNVLFVDADATGAGNGTSWANAFPNVQAALDAADAGNEIWVAEGTYYPDQGQTSGDRSATFQLESDVALYGGFDGDEDDRDARDSDPASNETVLSGDISVEDFPNDNSYHVVTGSGVNRSAVLDGFTVTAGRADDYEDESGAGMFNNDGNPTVRNVVFTENVASEFGGGMYNMQSSPRLENVLFDKNEASENGGAVNNFDNSNPSFTEVTFIDNTASDNGGAIRNGDASSPVLTDVTFRGNNADGHGGAIATVNSSNPVIIRAGFFDNTASQGGGMYSEDSDPRITNATFAGNAADDDGGGAYSDGSAHPMFINVVFSGNTADSGGGGLYVSEAAATLLNVTFGGNTADRDGGGLSLISRAGGSVASAVVRNSIFYDNNASSEGDQIFIDGILMSPQPQELSIGNTLVEGGLPEGVADTGGNIDGNPLFIDANGADNLAGTPDDNVRLQSSSPAINAGDNGALPQDEQDLDGDGNTTEALPVDLDGEARVEGGTVDMGAYER